MPFEGVEQIRHARHEPFATNPISDLPEADECALDSRRVRLLARSRDRTGTSTRRMVQESQGIFAVIAGGRDELRKNALFLHARRRDVARRNGQQQFAFARHAHHCLVFLPCAQRRGMGKIYS